MTLKDRYIRYLTKQPFVPVSREELLERAGKVGYPERMAKRVLYEIEDAERPDIGVWYGTKELFEGREEVKRTKWFCYYEITEEEYQKKLKDLQWFNSL